MVLLPFSPVINEYFVSQIYSKFPLPDIIMNTLKENTLICIFFIIGLQDLSPPALSLKQLLFETLATEPILLIISPGADPSEELCALAHATVGDQHYHEVHSDSE